MEEPMKRPKIPQTDSIQELAQFWDAHDLTDFEDQLEEVTEPIFERETVLQIHLPAQEASTVKEIAKAKGVAYTDLLREWVLEKIHRS
jgi:predicted DNA binding CopG/RHH family protein